MLRGAETRALDVERLLLPIIRDEVRPIAARRLTKRFLQPLSCLGAPSTFRLDDLDSGTRRCPVDVLFGEAWITHFCQTFLLCHFFWGVSGE